MLLHESSSIVWRKKMLRAAEDAVSRAAWRWVTAVCVALNLQRFSMDHRAKQRQASSTGLLLRILTTPKLKLKRCIVKKGRGGGEGRETKDGREIRAKRTKLGRKEREREKPRESQEDPRWRITSITKLARRWGVCEGEGRRGYSYNEGLGSRCGGSAGGARHI